jgi:hypothetical protein
MAPCSTVEVYRRFGGTCWFHLQTRRISQASELLATASFPPVLVLSPFCLWIRTSVCLLRTRWWTLGSIKETDLLTRWVTINFWRRTLHGVSILIHHLNSIYGGEKRTAGMFRCSSVPWQTSSRKANEGDANRQERPQPRLSMFRRLSTAQWNHTGY